MDSIVSDCCAFIDLTLNFILTSYFLMGFWVLGFGFMVECSEFKAYNQRVCVRVCVCARACVCVCVRVRTCVFVRAC